MRSLAARVGLTAVVVVCGFTILTAVTLERAFRASATHATAERLRGQLFLLLGATEVAPDGAITLPERLPEARLNLPRSGLYAEIGGPAGAPVWRSPSAVGAGEVPAAVATDGVVRRTAATGDYFLTGLRVDWEAGDATYPLTFTLIEDTQGYDTLLAGYRRSLWGWLAALAGLLIAAQAVALRWGLRPLRTVAAEVAAIERGAQQAVTGDYPRELRRLTANLNTLLDHERAQQSRYKNALADLAHSLKTPLAVLRAALDAGGRAVDTTTAAEQLERMDRIVAYQLQRAAVSGRATFAAPLPVAPAVERLVASLAKVYVDRGIDIAVEVDAGAVFRGPEGDLLELLGNLMDNACKYGHGRVRVTGACVDGLLQVTVEDDGPGIPAERVPEILARGGRLDETTPGTGIGLAVVHEIARAYQGELDTGSSSLGGAAVHLRLPTC